MTKARDLANASTALSAVSATELGYLDGVTSAVQTQLDNKVDETGGSVISANSSGNALEIRQTGAGNALVIEDSANPDSTPFTIDTNGLVWVGNTTDLPGVTERGIVVTDENTSGAVFVGRKSSTNTATNASLILAKSGGTAASPSVVVNGEYMGSVLFSGFDGTNYSPGAQIVGGVNGTPGVGDMPGMLLFLTSADGTASPTERMRIDATGNVGIGKTPSYALDVNGTVNATALYVGGAALSTTPTFIGCIAINTDQNTPFTTVGTEVAIPFAQTELVDTHNFHSTSTNPSRFTIPTGYGGKYLIQLNIGLASHNPDLYIYILKNGTKLASAEGLVNGQIVRQGNAYQQGDTFNVGLVVTGVAGDYFNWNIVVVSAGSGTNTIDRARCSFTYLGA